MNTGDFVKIKDTYFEEDTNFTEFLINKNEKRSYLGIIIKLHDGLNCFIPLRSQKPKNYRVQQLGVFDIPSKTKPDACLDMTKMLLNVEESYYEIINSDQIKLPRVQKNKIESNIDFIKKMAMKYINGYAKYVKKRTRNSNQKRDLLYQFSTLKNFHDLLGISTHANNRKDILILGIESSCDETAASVVKNGHTVLSNVVASQADIHKKFGGVVPEVASRHHVEAITGVIEAALTEANVTINDIDGIAVCTGPGLVGSLIVGLQAAKALSFAHNIPLVPVHHIAGHIYANALVSEMTFPLIALVVSGGHTELILMGNHNEFEYLGRTLDDAVGEAYDKVARILNIGYPGGPLIDKLATVGLDTYDLPRVWLDKNAFDFSFSGLKSAVINLAHNKVQRGETLHHENLAASFQASVVEVLTGKTMAALKAYDVKNLVVAGGVAANSGLRLALEKMAKEEHVNLSIPPLKYCTDNAAMIGAAGYVNFIQGRVSDLSIDAKPNLKLV